MFRTAEDALNFIAEHGIETVDLKVVDLPGRWHHVTMPAATFSKSVFEEGVGVDASSLSNFKGVECGDMVVIPDPSTAMIDPFWKAPTLSMICDLFEADTRLSFSKDPRTIAKKAEKFISGQSYAIRALFSPEYEFHIFDSI